MAGLLLGARVVAGVVMAGSLGLFGAASAHADTTLLPLFDVTNTTGEQTGVFEENGYTVTLAELNGAGIFVQAGFDMEPRYPVSGGQVIITQDGGGDFTFNSIGGDLGYGDSAAFTVQGLLGGVVMGTDTFFPTTDDLASMDASALAGITLDELIITGQRDIVAGVGFGNVSVSSVAPTPEPGSLMLLGSGVAGLATLRRRFVR